MDGTPIESFYQWLFQLEKSIRGALLLSGVLQQR